MEAFLGTILPVGFNFAPRGWAFCNGQLMNISQNSALFSLLGTTYGGDGISTFGIPDLRGRAIVGSQAPGPGLQTVIQGEKSGVNNATVLSSAVGNVTLTAANLPSHTHGVTVQGSSFTATSELKASTDNTGTLSPAAGSTLCSTQGVGGTAQAAIYQTTTPSALNTLNANSVATTISGTASVVSDATGNGTPATFPVNVTNQPVSVMQPYLGVNYIICVEGIFPSRN